MRTERTVLRRFAFGKGGEEGEEDGECVGFAVECVGVGRAVEGKVGEVEVEVERVEEDGVCRAWVAVAVDIVG